MNGALALVIAAKAAIQPRLPTVIPAQAGIYSPSLSLRDGEGAGG